MNRSAVLLLAVLTAVGLSFPAGAAEDAKLVKPVNLTVNTEADEEDPFVSSSGLTLWYASNAKGKFDILVAQRKSVRAAWGKGKLLEDYVRTEVDDRGVYATRDGTYPQYLYFATKKDREINNFDIYIAVKQNREAVFSAPTPVNAVDTEADEMYPWLTAGGKQLYFSRKTKEGWRVYLSQRAKPVGEAFGAPALVEDLPPDFHHVTLTSDGKTMYLQGPLDKERTGLFTATKTAKGWTKPEPLSMLNHPEAAKGDRAPALSADGSMLYFASDRPGGKGGFDLWVIPTAQLKKK
ncbi:MAG TPA: hypothetical protein VH682_17060 [Gemmataceae bacterium]|jgi:hypothetical protein